MRDCKYLPIDVFTNWLKPPKLYEFDVCNVLINDPVDVEMLKKLRSPFWQYATYVVPWSTYIADSESGENEPEDESSSVAQSIDTVFEVTSWVILYRFILSTIPVL